MTDPADRKEAHTGSHEEHYDPQANKIGMWLFLSTEIMLFTVIFITYAVYYYQFDMHFHRGSERLDVLLGGINTVVLLTSSLFMALAIGALQKGRKRASMGLLVLTILCALGFLVIKGFEWGAKFAHGYHPGSESLVDLHKGEQLFVGIYFLATGLHAFHVLVGMVLLGLVWLAVKSGRTHRGRISFIENGGLYWHLVDLIWIYIFPLFYLIS